MTLTFTLDHGDADRTPAVFRWSHACATGSPSARRTLLLIHFFRHSVLPQALTAGVTGAVGASVSGILSGIEGGGVGRAGCWGCTAVGSVAGALWVPWRGKARLYRWELRFDCLRAWLLQGCLPTRYKAGTDFDATSADVSIMELELSVESFQEYALSSSGVPVIT
jgi:hypothetical protein